MPEAMHACPTNERGYDCTTEENSTQLDHITTKSDTLASAAVWEVW